MRPPARTAISAIILAGGRGARMGGQDKARLMWRRRPLLQQLCREIRPYVRQIIVVRAHARRSPDLPIGVQQTHDEKAYSGPTGGLLAGLQRSRTNWCLCLPVDSLHPPQDLIAQLARRSSYQGAYVRHADNSYYLHQLIARKQRHTLCAFHVGGGRSAGNACRNLMQTPVDISAKQTVWSINTPEERQRVQRGRSLMRRRPLTA